MSNVNITLFDDGKHKNVLLEDFSGTGLAVQSNQHVIVDDGIGMILDPGGHKVYSKVLSATNGLLGRAKLQTIFLSHQDPDIVAAVNGWLMTTDATAYVSKLWVRFVAHFGLDRLVESRLLPIPDEGMDFPVGCSTSLSNQQMDSVNGNPDDLPDDCNSTADHFSKTMDI